MLLDFPGPRPDACESLEDAALAPLAEHNGGIRKVGIGDAEHALE